MLKFLGSVIGTVVGIPLGITAVALGFTNEMVGEAVDAGCETKEEIKEFCNKK